MKHPTSQQVQVVLDNFAKVLPIANGHQHLLDMGDSRVRIPRLLEELKYEPDEETIFTVGEKKYVCNTPMCHGGWYAAAVFTNKQVQEHIIDYGEGASRIAFDLGFTYKEDSLGYGDKQIQEELKLGARYDLTDWARQNPKIWGNDNGDEMFSFRSAFSNEEKRPNGAKSLQEIVDHWTEVRDRLAELEAQPKEEVVDGN
jgi:hypothetical protein